MLVSSYLFPFYQLYPRINKVWLSKQPRSWSKMQFSPGEENLFLLYYAQFRAAIEQGEAAPNASCVEFMRDHEWMSQRGDGDIKKMAQSMRKRKNDPVAIYRSSGRLLRPHIWSGENMVDACYVDFVAFDEQLRTGRIDPLKTHVAEFLMQFTCYRQKSKEKTMKNSTTSDDENKKMKLTEKQNIMETLSSSSPVKRIDQDKKKQIENAQFINKSLKETLLNNAEQLLNANHVHATAAEVIESMPDQCHVFVDAENAAPPQQTLEKAVDELKQHQILTVLRLLAANKGDELMKVVPGSMGENLSRMMISSSVTETETDENQPQQVESSNSSSFIANSHSLFATLPPPPSPKVEEKSKLTGRQIAEEILVPMIEEQLRLPSPERDIYKHVSSYCNSHGKDEKWFRGKIATIYDNLVCSSSSDDDDE